MSHKPLTIGTVARQAGVNVETIRYYQRRGLLREPARPLAGFRPYSEEDIQRLRFIKRAQTLGFTLEEIANLLKLNDGLHCGEARELAAKKLALIEDRIADLQAMRKTLKELIQECNTGGRPNRCPIIASLGGLNTK
jgi:MerR family transcriptional regulator, mercuric resistance operon regulatory protein